MSMYEKYNETGTKMSQKIFLLGGYDLEMLTIKELLDENNIKYIDKKLSWGSKLSEYEEYFNDKDEFVGIELQKDITPPLNYKEIDHHGKNSHKKSSLEQIAELLDIKLTRYQKLVAANDTSYILGMKQLCATDEEIKDIREKDRKTQGVTEDDEVLALKSIENATSNVVYSLTQHFSAVADRVASRFTQYIIFNDTKIVFYGYDIKKVLHCFEKQLLDEDSFYYGGGEYGFVGIKEGVLERDKITLLIKGFREFMQKNEIVSYHTFMLPFTFENKFKKTKDWEYKPFEVESNERYNEYVYFYKHVQEALFNKKGEEKSFSDYYEYKEQSGSFVIECKNGRYELGVDGISLRVFQTDVAILSFNLVNRHYTRESDILSINEFGRRIYPQFLGKNGVCETKNAFLANSITLRLDKMEPIVEDFSRYNNVKEFTDNLLPSYIKALIQENFHGENIRPIIDDRMFVISQYNDDTLSSKMQKYDEKNGYVYENDDFWYQYIFVDGNGKTSQSRYLTKKLIIASTYDRWVEYGTLFGVSRYSFVALTGSEYGKNILLPHMRTIYFQIFTLLLAYRATIIKFSDDIQDTTNAKKDIAKKTKQLYKKYLDFLNKLYFKEVTAQDQGIELYNKAMKVMEIPKYMQDLDNEMNELHTYIKMIEEQQQNEKQEKMNKKLNEITMYGGILLLASFFTGFFGMNIGINFNPFWAIFVVLLSTIGSYCYLKKGDT